MFAPIDWIWVKMYCLPVMPMVTTRISEAVPMTMPNAVSMKRIFDCLKESIASHAISLNDPHYHFAEWFRADWGLYPYVGMDILIVNLQRFVSIETSGRIFVSLCVVSLPLSVLWFLRWVNRGHDLLAFFALFFGYDMFLLQGFLNF